MEITKILMAGGSVDLSARTNLHEELMRAIVVMRGKLGKHSNLLDDFLLGILSAFAKISVLDAVDEGFQDAATELRQLCLDIREGTESAMLHPFYPTLENLIEKYPCSKNTIFVDFYFALAANQFSSYALGKYLENRKMNIQVVMKEARVDELRDHIVKLTNPTELEQLCDLLCQRFYPASTSTIFLQCLADQCLLSWITQNGDSRYVFQYLLDAENEA